MIVVTILYKTDQEEFFSGIYIWAEPEWTEGMILHLPKRILHLEERAKTRSQDLNISPFTLFFFFFNLFNLFMAVLGLRFCARAPSSCGKRGPLLIAVRGPLTIAASPAAEHRLQTRRLSNCGSRAQLLCGMWDLPRPGLEPVSPASAGWLPTTVPPGKPQSLYS